MTTKSSTAVKTPKNNSKSDKHEKGKWYKTQKPGLTFIKPVTDNISSTQSEVTVDTSGESNWKLLKQTIVQASMKKSQKSSSAVKKPKQIALSSEKSKKKKPKIKKAAINTDGGDSLMNNLKRKRGDESAECEESSKRSRTMNQSLALSSDHTTASKDEIWFDDVDPDLLEGVTPSPPTDVLVKDETRESHKVVQSVADGGKYNKKSTESRLVKPASYEGLTCAMGIDCEMVEVSGSCSALARVSIVNVHGHCVYDSYVKPKEKVTDYRTRVSGIRPHHLKHASSLEEVQKRVFAIVDKRLLVGHALKNDLQVLFMSHPKKLIRDTSRYSEFRKVFDGKTPSLKNLSQKLLGVQIQSGEHNSIEDARAAMRLYTMYKPAWEKSLNKRTWNKRGKQSKSVT